MCCEDVVKKQVQAQELDPVFENMKRYTKTLIQERSKQPLVQTEQFREAETMLQSKGVVTIAGKPGEGKTYMALRVVDQIFRVADNRIVLMYNPSQWDHVDILQLDVIIIDDIFGKHNLDREMLMKWLPVLKQLQMYVEAGQVKVVITTRDNILTESEILIKDFELLMNLVHLSSDRLSQNDKVLLLESMLDYYKRDKSVIDVQKCCQKYTAPIGFPYSCFLFSVDMGAFSKGNDFFKRPLYFFRENLMGLNRSFRAALLFLFYKQGSCSEKDMKPKQRNKENADIKDLVASFVGLNENDLSLQGIKEGLIALNGSYVTFVEKTFTFAHNTVYECIALLHGVEYQEEVIQFCTWDFLNGCITLDDTEIADLKLVITEDNFELLSERFSTDILNVRDSSRLYNFRDHPAVQNELFCTLFFETVQKAKKLKELFTREMDTKTNFGGFFHRCLRQDGDSSMKLVNCAIPFLICDCESNSTSTCWKCNVKNDALRATCLSGKRDFFHFLLKQKALLTLINLSDSCEGKNDELVKDIVIELKRNNNLIDGNEVYTSKALLYAKKDPKEDTLYSFLKNEGINPTPISVFHSCQENDLNLIKFFVSELSAMKRWDPGDKWINFSLRELLRNKNFEAYNFLKENGVHVNTYILPEAVRTGDLETVKHVVDDIKRCGYWRVQSEKSISKLISQLHENASRGIASGREVFEKFDQTGIAEAILEARYLSDKTIYEYLTSEKVQLTMEMLKWAVKKGNLEFLKSIIDELKDTKRWTQTSSEAGEALCAAWEANTDMFQLLRREGLHFTMENIYTSIRTADLDLIKAIVEDLKGNGLWNPLHASLHLALTESYDIPNRVIFNYLKGIGITINVMSIMTAIVSVNPTAVKMYIDVMKNSGTWDPSDPMLNMCLTLSQVSLPEVYQLLKNEGVGTSSSTLVQYAMRNDVTGILTMEELIKSGRWNPTEDKNIIKAFEMYIQRRNVTMYNALIKKGCLLNRRHLIMMLIATSSLVYNCGLIFKKAVQPVPSLAALTAVKIVPLCLEAAVEHNALLALVVSIHALEETNTSSSSCEYFLRAVNKVMEKKNPQLYNILIDSDFVLPIECIEKLITGVYKDVSSRHKSFDDNNEGDEATAEQILSVKEQVQGILKRKPDSLISKSLELVWSRISYKYNVDKRD